MPRLSPTAVRERRKGKEDGRGFQQQHSSTTCEVVAVQADKCETSERPRLPQERLTKTNVAAVARHHHLVGPRDGAMAEYNSRFIDVATSSREPWWRSNAALAGTKRGTLLCPFESLTMDGPARDSKGKTSDESQSKDKDAVMYPAFLWAALIPLALMGYALSLLITWGGLTSLCGRFWESRSLPVLPSSAILPLVILRTVTICFMFSIDASEPMPAKIP